MDRNKFWYYVGAVVGIVLRAAIYAAGIYGIVTQVWNHEIPYIPVILLLTFHAWGKILVIYEAVGWLVNHRPQAVIDTAEIEKVVKAVNFKNLYFGGPN